jgi:hypothetical protein
MQRKLVAVVGLVGWLAALAAPAKAQDWPQWRGPNRDARAAGFAAPAEWPTELAQKWDVPIGA